MGLLGGRTNVNDPEIEAFNPLLDLMCEAGSYSLDIFDGYSDASYYVQYIKETVSRQVALYRERNEYYVLMMKACGSQIVYNICIQPLEEPPLVKRLSWGQKEKYKEFLSRLKRMYPGETWQSPTEMRSW